MSLISRYKKQMILGLVIVAYAIALVWIDPHAGNDAPNIVALLVALEQAPNAIGTRTKSSKCQPGSLPDPKCTPGAIFPEATLEEICEKGYTQTVRNVSTGLKKKVYKEYGIPYPQPKGSYEADHLIPLELGGANDIANLFPQPKTPSPGFPDKDLVENFLHQEACAGRISLEKAQKAIAADWIKIYESIGAAELEELKKKYGGWAN